MIFIYSRLLQFLNRGKLLQIEYMYNKYQKVKLSVPYGARGKKKTIGPEGANIKIVGLGKFR